MDHLSFKDYLISKKIDPAAFERGDASTYASFKALYEQVHPKSFTAQKLFLINKIRRSYQLKEESETKKVLTQKKAKAVIRRKQ
ncbi:MAG: hypothetical protein ACPGJS_08245 [Flammeovirgaceae bacterium]